MELFYEEWTLPVKTWAFSYAVSIVYAAVLVYTLIKICSADELYRGLFDQIIPSKQLEEVQPPVPIITQLKSYCGSTGTISHKQVSHYQDNGNQEDQSKGELLLQ